LENTILSKLPVEILMGKKNLEIRPHQINKGEVIKRLIDHHRKLLLQSNNAGGGDIEFVFCAGDDKTDEDMFRALRLPRSSPLHTPPASAGPTIHQKQHQLNDHVNNNVVTADNNGGGMQISNSVFTCTIGSATKKTIAMSHLNKSEELISLLEQLADSLE
jgi:trehalose 6-phosphate synthase/phosphatase